MSFISFAAFGMIFLSMDNQNKRQIYKKKWLEKENCSKIKDKNIAPQQHKLWLESKLRVGA